MYKINPSKYNGVTVIPSEISEKYLKISSASQLKVIICAFSLAGKVFGCETLSEKTGISIEETADIIEYWKKEGFLLLSDENVSFTAENDSKKIPDNDKHIPLSVNTGTEKLPSVTHSTAEKEVQQIRHTTEKAAKLPENNPTRLSYDEICVRVAESEEIRILLNEAQLKLGRTVGTGDQSSLILLHDYYGLPIEVILCICEYARTKGKSSNMNYIYKIGADWSHREIDTLEAADEELKSIEKVNGVWTEFCKKTGIEHKVPTSSQERFFVQWSEIWKFPVPVIAAAFEEMKSHTDKISYNYMHKILSSWHLKGILTLDDVAKEKERFIRENEEKAAKRTQHKKDIPTEIKPDPTASYDIKRAEQKALTGVPTIKKRTKRQG